MHDPMKLARPIVLALVGLFMAGASADLALSPGGGDVGQPVAQLVLPIGLSLTALAIVWLLLVVRSRR